MKISHALITSFALFVFFLPACFRKLSPFLMTQTATSGKLCIYRLQNINCLRKCRPNYWLFSLPYPTLFSLFLSGYLTSPLYHYISFPCILFLSHSLSLLHSLSLPLSFSCFFSLSLSNKCLYLAEVS